MKIQIQKSAVGDLRTGYKFYEKQETGLGDYFLESLCSDIESLKLYSGTHPIHFGKFHRMLSKRFPYAVYYQTKEETIYIRAIVDLRRDPKWLLNKIKRL